MTQTIETPEPAPPPTARSSGSTPGSPASRRPCGRATSSARPGMFATTSFWRDLVAFSWNITTVENRDGVAELLAQTLEGTDPSGFALEEPPTRRTA